MLQPMQPMATNASFRSIASWLSDNIASMQEKMMAMCHQGLDREFLEPILVRRSTPPQRLNCNPTSNRHANTIPCIPIFKHVPTCHIYGFPAFPLSLYDQNLARLSGVCICLSLGLELASS